MPRSRARCIAAFRRSAERAHKNLVVGLRVEDRQDLALPPTLVSQGASFATACHDYPRPYDLTASPTTRHTQYRKRLRALDRRQFFPFSPSAWLGTTIDAGPKCLDWPADTRARSGVRRLKMPDVPTLVMSGDLDSTHRWSRDASCQESFPTGIALTDLRIPRLDGSPRPPNEHLAVARNETRQLDDVDHVDTVVVDRTAFIDWSPGGALTDRQPLLVLPECASRWLRVPSMVQPSMRFARAVGGWSWPSTCTRSCMRASAGLVSG